jgi:hypothetical protein
MSNIKEFIYKKVEELGFKRESVLPFIIAVGITLTFFLDSTYFQNRLMLLVWVFIGITISALITWIAVNAGFTVLKNFFILSAEISLLIFLAQSYCENVKVVQKSDGALRSLVTLGIIYISYEFFKALSKALKVKLDSIPDKKWSKEKIIAVGIFLIFTGVFVYTIYQVTSPIIFNLCVFNR